MAGRRPKPTALKKAQGNPGKRAINKREPKTSGLPIMPEHLTDRAKTAWFYVLPMLLKKGLAGDVDALALERLCETYAEIIELQAELKEEGRTYTTTNEAGDTMYKSMPQQAMLADADRRFKSYLVEFGMTPAARTKVQISEAEKPEDKEAEFFGPRAG